MSCTFHIPEIEKSQKHIGTVPQSAWSAMQMVLSCKGVNRGHAGVNRMYQLWPVKGFFPIPCT